MQLGHGVEQMRYQTSAGQNSARRQGRRRDAGLLVNGERIRRERECSKEDKPMSEGENDAPLSEGIDTIHNTIYFRCSGNDPHAAKVAILVDGAHGLEVVRPVDALEAGYTIWSAYKKWFSVCTALRCLKKRPFRVPPEKSGATAGRKRFICIVGRRFIRNWRWGV